MKITSGGQATGPDHFDELIARPGGDEFAICLPDTDAMVHEADVLMYDAQNQRKNHVRIACRSGTPPDCRYAAIAASGFRSESRGERTG